MQIIGPYQPDEAYPALDYSVELDGVVFRLRLTYRERQDRWYVDLLDAADTELITGKMLAPGVPLFEDYRNAALPTGWLMLVDTSGAGEPCGYEDLGWRCLLVYVPLSEIPAAEDEYSVTIAAA